MPKRKANEPEIGAMIRRHGGDWHKYTDRQYCPHCHQLTWKTDSLPFDGMATIGGVAIPIEIKQGEKSLALTAIRDNQREGLKAWMERHGRLTWLALTLGTDRVNSKSELRRRSWLIPWPSWMVLESLLDILNYKSLPYSPGTTHRLVSAVSFFEKYELEWRKGWYIPHTHLFAQEYAIGE